MRIHIPAEVPANLEDRYVRNYTTATSGTDNLLLFAGDQKLEHMHDDFFGDGISPEDADPEHMFKIASQAKIGCFASQLGLISRYGRDYNKIPYLVKMNSKTHAVKPEQAESISRQWCTMEQLDTFIQTSHLNVIGVGYTVYVGSEHESKMYREAAQLAFEAHRRGMIAIFWMYPRGKGIPNERDPKIIAGSAGIGACLGADFVKVNPPKVPEGQSSVEALKMAVAAAGRTRLICAGGSTMPAREYLQMVYDQIHIAGAHGTAAGRNIHQRSLDEAIRFCNALHALIAEGKTVDEAMTLFDVTG